MGSLRLRTGLASLLLSLGCRPSLGPATLLGHPAIKLEIEKPIVVEASQPDPPAWIAATSTTGAGRWAFIGQASAPTLEAAEVGAHRDLLRAIAEFVEVQVEYEHETISEHEADAHGSKDSERSFDESRSRTGHSLTIAQGTAVADRYWERVAAPARPAIFRSYLRAWVDERLVAEARLESQLTAERNRGRKIVVVNELTSNDPKLAHAMTAELERRLLESPGLCFFPPLPPPLAPDLELAGSIEVHGKVIRVRYTLVGAKAASNTIEGDRAGLFDLEDRLANAIMKDLGGDQP